MISYKRDVLERQRSKYGQWLSISERVCKKLCNTLKTMFLNVKLQMLCKSHDLQCITSSTDSEKLEKSLCIRDKAEDLCWMLVVFGPSDDTHQHDSVIDITKWAQEYFQKPLSVSTIRRAICRCQVKLYHAKGSHMWTWSKAPSCPVGQGLFKMDCFKVEKCSMVRWVQIWHSCWKSRMPCPPG